MSKGGWARLMKQQQQESTQSQSVDNEYQVHKYKNIISSKQQLANMNVSTATTTCPLSIKGSMLQVDQGGIRPSKLLQIVRRWKTQTAKQITPRPHRSTTSSSTSCSRSCSRLNFVPLSCITFSSIQLYSDEEEIEGEADGDGNDIDIVSDALSKSTKVLALDPLHHQSRSSDMAESSHRHTTKDTQYCTGKERESTCERKVQATARRALSCPKLSSPLSACTAFPSMQGDVEEELESLKPKEEEGGSMKLRRSSSSSPLRKYSISKQSTTPKGYLALYVGEERRRFLVKANLLNHPLFSILLEKAKEEFGFDQKGALNIPCDIPFFQQIMFLVESN